MTPSVMSDDARAATKTAAHLPLGRSDCARAVSEMAVCKRQGNPPLRFKGQLVTHHAMRVTQDCVIHVKLWERKKKQLVVAHSQAAGGQIGSDAVQHPDLESASAYLEDICAAFKASAVAGEEPWSHVHFHLWFGQHFERLCTDVLNDWQSLTEQEQTS